MNTRLWYNKVKTDWMDALALGNGRVGAMFFGLPDCERIEINEESLWSGRPLEEETNITPEIMTQIQKLLFEEEYEEASKLAKQYYISKPNRLRSYESFGNVYIDFADKTEVKDYYKYLELSTAIAGTKYLKGNAKYTTECFVSEKYDTFVYKAKTDDNIPFDCNITMSRTLEAVSAFYPYATTTREKDYTIALLDENTLQMTGRLKYDEHPERGDAGTGMDFVSLLKVKTDGKCSKADEVIEVVGATYVEIYGDFETNYDVKRFVFDRAIDIKTKAYQKIDAVFAAEYEDIKSEHIKNHQKLFGNVSFELNGEKERYDIPTDELLSKAKEGEIDLGLVELYFNFGRYLLLESSGKKATLPANLQGIWATDFDLPWNSDFHTNINLQMNYWPCEVANLSSVFAPFNHFVKMISLFGRETAIKLYNARGWTIHHNTDVFGRCGVHDRVECGAFPMAGPWLCLNLWEHFEYTNDLEYLKEIYPILKSSCEFMLDFLVESPDGYLVTNPSNSPENSFYYYDKNGEKKKSMFTYGATMDFEIIECIFTRVMSACKLLDKDKDFAQILEKTLKRLPPLKISERYGTVCEWIKDYEEVEPEHRHISHMFALYPSDSINEDTPELFKAAKETVGRRVSHGGGKTGWSRAWLTIFYARLKDSDAVWQNLLYLLKTCTADNLFDIHPPFQIDGNFGGCTAICEMLIQSHRGAVGDRIVEILPAIPKDWESGCVKGLKARGNFEFDITWENSKLKEIVVVSHSDNTLKIMLSDILKGFKTQKEHCVDGDVLTIQMSKGEKVVIGF